MTYEYKWYTIKVNSDSERNVRALVGNHTYFKDILVPYQSLCGFEEVLELYLYMYLCDESKNILNEIPGFYSGDSKGVFTVISDSDINLKFKEFGKYKWYILRVASNYEEKVRQYIQENSKRLIMGSYFKELLIPYEESSEIELRSKKIVAKRKYFPGYIFLYINLCDEVLNFINNIPRSLKVYGFLKNGNVPKVISDDEINLMHQGMCSSNENKKLSYGYEKGEKVKINGGLFQDFIGKIEMVNDDAKTVNVEVSILGKSTIIGCDINQLEKIEN